MDKKLFIIITLIVLSLGSVIFYLLDNPFFSHCDSYDNYLVSRLSDENSKYICNNNQDCELTALRLCESFAIHKDVNLTKFYKDPEMDVPFGCLQAQCEKGSKEAICSNGTCMVSP